MRIVKLEAENFKRLKAVEITPDGNTVVVSGRNAQGKSSVLDAIWAALAGKDGQVKRPVREGQHKARVRLDLGEVVVERKWSGERTSLEVTAATGAKFPSPQRMLDDLIGSLSFDPLAFAGMHPRDQRKTLVDLADLPFDPEQLDFERKQAYDERTVVNREVKNLNAQLEAMTWPAGTPDEEVSVGDLVGRLQAATQAAQRRKALLDEYNRNQAEIVRLQNRNAAIVSEGKTLTTVTESEIAALESQINGAEETNKAVRVKQQYRKLAADAAERAAVAKALTQEIENIDRRKVDGFARAKLPIEGLSFDDEGVLYNGVPFTQASSAERLRVSVAMAMALNPNIRVIRITDGSLLDSDNLALIEQMATDSDFQVWVERVSDGDGVGVRIEDGEVAQ